MTFDEVSHPADVEGFKSNAWMTRSGAKSYARATNDGSLSALSAVRYVDWLEELHPNAKVLDAGAGTGALTTALAQHGFRVTALDVSQEMLDRIPRSHRVRKVVGDVLKPSLGLPQGAEKYGAIVSRWVLPHFPSWPAIIRNMSDLLLPGGGGRSSSTSRTLITSGSSGSRRIGMRARSDTTSVSQRIPTPTTEHRAGRR